MIENKKKYSEKGNMFLLSVISSKHKIKLKSLKKLVSKKIDLRFEYYLKKSLNVNFLTRVVFTKKYL